MQKQKFVSLILALIILTACALVENHTENLDGMIVETVALPSPTAEQIRVAPETTPEATETADETPEDNLIMHWIGICEGVEMGDCILALTNMCDLPCLWGIVPGDTHVSAFDGFVSTFELFPDIRLIDKMSRYGTGFPLDDPIEGYQAFSTTANFFAEKDSETFKWIHYEITKLFANANSLAYYEKYLPQAIFARYGTPSRIIFGVGFPADPPLDVASYGLDLFYDDLGFAITYYGVTEYSQTLDICFSYSSAPFFFKTVDIYIKSVNDPSTLEEIMGRIHQWDLDYTPSSQMFDEFISMEIDEFVALFEGEDPEVCFLLDLDALKTFTEE